MVDSESLSPLSEDNRGAGELAGAPHGADDPGAGSVPVSEPVGETPNGEHKAPQSVAAPVERLANEARDFSLGGFQRFFYLTNRAEGKNLNLPKHAWGGVRNAIDLLRSDNPNKTCVWEWHRESAKSTVAATLAAWLVGQRPDGTIGVFHANEQSAQHIASNIAERIDSPIFTLVFPNVKPDPLRAWSVASGYWVQDTSMPPEVWAQNTVGRTTPSVFGLGLESAAIRGKRVTLLLLADDITDDDAAASERELVAAGRRFDHAILPLVGPKCLVLVVGTPQARNDILDTMKKRSPILTRVPVYKEGTKESSWPEWWPPERIEATKIRVQTLAFAKNYELDLEAASKLVLRHYEFPHDKIDLGWQFAAGVDYASMSLATMSAPGRSHYAIAYLGVRPRGGLVVFDGIVGQFPQEECEFLTAQAQTLFQNFMGTSIEAIGKGEEHYYAMTRRPGLKLVPTKSHRRSKPDRLVMELGPDLQRGSILISDAQSEFLNEARRFMNSFPAVSNDDKGWDILDSIYLARSILIPWLLATPIEDAWKEALPKKISPWGELARSKL